MTLELHLHKKQGIVYKSKARFKVLIAGRRFGKTILAIITLLLEALLNENRYLWYVAPTYRQAKMIAWRLLKNIIPKGEVVKINESELSIEFRNGSQIELKGADNEDSLRGTGLDGLVIDEFASIFNNWSVWNEVLRPTLTDKKGWALFIGTPKGKDALFELFLKGQKKEDDFESWQFKTLDNPYIDPIEVDKARQELPGRYFRQEYEASFEDFTGLIYPEFNKNLVIQPTYLPAVYSRIGAIDPALGGITAVLKCAIDEKGTLIFYEEYYEQNKRASEVAGQVREDIEWLIDPASSASNVQKEGKLYSLYDEYADNGIRAKSAENDVDAGINRVGEYLKQGKIKIFSNCTNLIYELERYHWSEDKETSTGLMKSRPYKKNDHLCDCLRYICMSRPDKSEFKEEPINPNSAWGQYLLKQKSKDEFTRTH